MAPGLSCSTARGISPDPGMAPVSFALAGGFFTTEHSTEAPHRSPEQVPLCEHQPKSPRDERLTLQGQHINSKGQNNLGTLALPSTLAMVPFSVTLGVTLTTHVKTPCGGRWHCPPPLQGSPFCLDASPGEDLMTTEGWSGNNRAPSPLTSWLSIHQRPGLPGP